MAAGIGRCGELNMEARKLATQMVAICPFAMLLGMGYSARQPVPGHTILKYSDAQNARLQAYRPIVAAAPSAGSEMRTIRRHADLWIRLAPRERLQALTPAFQEDMSEDNARAEIIGQWRCLEGQLNHEMRRELVDGHLLHAVEDGVRIIRLSEILKYSDFDTMHFASIVTTRTVSLIGPLLGKAPKRDRLDFNAAAGAVNGNRGKLIYMYKVIKANYEDYVVRRIGFGRELGPDATGAGDDEGSALSMSTGSLQRAYVSAIRDEARFRKSAQTYLGLAVSSVRS